MAGRKAPVYKEKDTQTCLDKITELRKECAPLEHIDGVLYAQLTNTIDELEVACRAVLPISRGGHRIGFGVDKAAKDLKVAIAMELLKQIKAMKAW